MAIVGKENEFELLKQELYGLAYFVDPVLSLRWLSGAFSFFLPVYRALWKNCR